MLLKRYFSACLMQIDMRPLCLFIALLSGGLNTGLAQTYHKLPQGEATWSEIFRQSDFFPYSMHFVRLSTTDTLLGGIIYRKVYRSDDTIFTESEQIGGMREDTVSHRIYGYLYYGVCAYQDMLMYDFNVQPGDTLEGIGAGNCVNWVSDLIVHSIDSIQVDGSYRKKINLRLAFSPSIDLLPSAWVDGVGNVIRGLVFSSGNMPNNGMWNELICLHEGYQMLYQDITDWNTYDTDTAYQLFDCATILQGIKILLPQPTIAVVPNPVTSESKLIIPGGARALRFSVYDGSGRLVKALTLQDKNTVMIQRSDFAPGIYFWKLISENGQAFYGKIAVE